MFQNWLNNIADLQLGEYKKNKFGGKIEAYTTDQFPDLKGTNIALIGQRKNEADKIRLHLYNTSYNFPSLKITDLGNLKSEESEFAIPVIRELIRCNIFPIIIGGKIENIPSQFQAYFGDKTLLKTLFIQRDLDDFYDPDSNNSFLNILSSNREKIFNAALVGYQAPYCNLETLSILSKNYFDLLRLGEIKGDLKKAEPILRDADMISFNINSIRQAEAPGQIDPVPSGLTLEESCQLGRYGGMNENLSSFGIYGYEADKDNNDLTAKLIAQITWYFIEGFYLRTFEKPDESEAATKFIIDAHLFDEQLTFLKSNSTGRWWIKIPKVNSKLEQRHKLIPCSYEDYLAASKDQIPDRILNAIYRFS